MRFKVLRGRYRGGETCGVGAYLWMAGGFSYSLGKNARSCKGEVAFFVLPDFWLPNAFVIGRSDEIALQTGQGAPLEEECWVLSVSKSGAFSFSELNIL
jgi:hypothetical protein